MLNLLTHLKHSTRSWLRTMIIGLLVALLVGNVAWAASPNTGDTEEQNRRTRQQEAERQQGNAYNWNPCVRW